MTGCRKRVLPPLAPVLSVPATLTGASHREKRPPPLLLAPPPPSNRCCQESRSRSSGQHRSRCICQRSNILLLVAPTQTRSARSQCLCAQLTMLRNLRPLVSKAAGASKFRPQVVAARGLATPSPMQTGNEAIETRPPVRSHSVEELHSLTAEEILKETGSRKDASMRHFTGESGLLAPDRGEGAQADLRIRRFQSTLARNIPPHTVCFVSSSSSTARRSCAPTLTSVFCTVERKS